MKTFASVADAVAHYYKLGYKSYVDPLVTDLNVRNMVYITELGGPMRDELQLKYVKITHRGFLDVIVEEY